MKPIEIRDKRLRDGRLSISAKTESKPIWRRRESAIRKLIEWGEFDIIERLRSRELHIEQVQKAVEASDLDALRRSINEPLTLGAVLDRSMETVEATSEHGTQRAYKTVAKMLREWKGNDFDIRKLTKDEAEKWVFAPKATIGGKPWSAARQILVTVLAGRIWNDAIEREREASEIANTKPRLTRNPWRAIETKGVRKKRAAYLQPEDWRRLIEKVRGTPKALAFGFGVLAGLRRGEIVNLRHVDIDLDRNILHVQPRTGEFAWRPKTDRSIRTLDISAELRELIEEHIASGFASQRYLIRGEGKDQPLGGTSIERWTREAYEAVGLRYGMEGDGLTIHSTRHTFASWLVQAGVSPMVVAHLIGDSVAMVIDVYGHLAPRNYREAMQLVGKVAKSGFNPVSSPADSENDGKNTA